MEEVLKNTVELCSRIASGISELSLPPAKDGEGSLHVDDKLAECGLAICGLLRRQTIIALSRKGDFKLLQRRLDDLISLATDKFYAYPFKDVPECWRRLFTDASIVKACSLLAKSVWAGDGTRGSQPKASMALDSNVLDEVVKALDMACIMAGAPGPHRKEWIEKMFDLLSQVCEATEDAAPEPPSKRRKLGETVQEDSFPNLNVFIPPVSHPVERISSPSLPRFEKHMHQLADPAIGSTPLIIENAIDHWPALSERPWKRPSYLLSKTLGGRRLVPVEVGRSYVDEGWSQKIIPFGVFMDDYLFQQPPKQPSIDSAETNSPLRNDSHRSPPTTPTAAAAPARSSTGYLAQHDLFTQIRSLRADISVPDFCYSSAPAPHPSSPQAAVHAALPLLADPLLHAWLGPAGTISPLHTDPYHNILCQVVGRKYLRLYAPAESARLYARSTCDHGGLDMSNTSAVDVGVLAGWDGGRAERESAELRFPLFEGAKYLDCVLEEGECLYIPVGWWHYVRSLSVSFSVSFWWN